MAEYDGRIDEKKLTFLRPDLFGKWCKKNVGSWFRAEFKIKGKHSDPKTAEQLGYYWACLVPLTKNELAAQGHTMTVKAFGLEKEIPFNEDATHELLTALCGHVGPDGKHLRLSECNKYETVKFIDNVVEFDVVSLGMNEEALKAQRPV